MGEEKRTPEEELLEEVEKDVAKKIKAEKEGKEIMFGLGFFGIVGWSITVPTLLAIALGVYLDKRFSSNFSWTLTLIFVGVILGSFNAWRWLNDNSQDREK
ncbi:MAG TPA: AtpZ/AtpI family protein [Clostridia bacterium]|nr:AtpZ/AtpI family protein [Clostridia bacterium]